MRPIPALLFLPPKGGSTVEKWMAEARLAAASDLLQRLLEHGGFEPVYVLAADEAQQRSLTDQGAILLTSPVPEFHFGRVLAALVEELDLDQLAYFGGASAPLLLGSHLDRALMKLRIDNKPRAVVNNLYSTDWILLNRASALKDLTERLPADNPLGWVLSTEANLPVFPMAAEAATRLDLDTPVDLAMLVDHPALGPHLESFVRSMDVRMIERVNEIRTLLKTPASTLAIIGRCSSHVWRALEDATQVWIRMFVEERGMVSSRRLADGKVKSLIGELVDMLGPAAFFEQVHGMAQGLLWDNRIWMGMERAWPDPADRFAADLGLVEQVSDRRLRELTQAVQEAKFPILVGGYGVVAGGIYALLESTFWQEGSGYHPSR